MSLELPKVSINYNNVSMQGHMEMCIPCFSITMPGSWDDNTVCASMKKFIKYTKVQINRLRLRFTMLGIDKNTCKWILELEIKCRFRGRRGRHIHKLWTVKWEQFVKTGLANVRSLKKKTEEIIHNIMEEELDLSFICETWIDIENSVTKVKSNKLLSFKGNKQRSGKG